MRHSIFNFNNLIRNRKATTLLEIITALIIMALTFIPIIASIGTSTKDTDVANSYVFAQTQARNILDTLLDDVPFNCINGSGNIGTMVNVEGYNLAPFRQMIGASGSNMQGVITDERGVRYTIRIYVQPIADNDLYFAYLPRPRFEIASSTDNSTNAISSNWYNYPIGITQTQASYIINRPGQTPIDPYDLNANYGNGTIATQTRRVSELWTGFGIVPPLMKKILLQIEWTARDGKVRKFELYTMKANLDIEG